MDTKNYKVEIEKIKMSNNASATDIERLLRETCDAKLEASNMKIEELTNALSEKDEEVKRLKEDMKQYESFETERASYEAERKRLGAMVRREELLHRAEAEENEVRWQEKYELENKRLHRKITGYANARNEGERALIRAKAALEQVSKKRGLFSNFITIPAALKEIDDAREKFNEVYDSNGV